MTNYKSPAAPAIILFLPILAIIGLLATIGLLVTITIKLLPAICELFSNKYDSDVQLYKQYEKIFVD